MFFLLSAGDRTCFMGTHALNKIDPVFETLAQPLVLGLASLKIGSLTQDSGGAGEV